MISTLDAIDKELMIFLNQLGSEGLDPLMIFISSELGWLPWYLFLAGSLWYFFGWKGMLLGLLGCALSVTLTDQISVNAFKEVFMRLRPCHQEELIPFLRVPDGCGGQFGFVSSHAANTAGVATFLFRLLPDAQWTRIALVFWAAIVAYSRVYLGVHFPGDVVGGAMLGVLLGYLVSMLFLRWSIFNPK